MRVASGPSAFYPQPILKKLVNRTPFVHFQCDKMGPGRRFFDIVVVKAAFELRPDQLQLSMEPARIVFADETWIPARATRSSLRLFGDLHLPKPGTDLVVTGTARAHDARPREVWNVSVSVHSGEQVLMRHSLSASGPRFWHFRTLRGWGLSAPQPTIAVPIRYELAYGGSYHKDGPLKSAGRPLEIVCEDNPSGRGFVDQEQLDRHQPVPAPQWEYPGHRLTRLNEPVRVAGLGPIARWWPIRRRHAGTYSEEWKADAQKFGQYGIPIDYPSDFDSRFFFCAPEAQRIATPLRGGERLELEGLVSGYRLFVSHLPAIELVAALKCDGKIVEEEFVPLDTIHIDLDANRVALAWRLALNQVRGIDEALIYGRHWQ